MGNARRHYYLLLLDADKRASSHTEHAPHTLWTNTTAKRGSVVREQKMINDVVASPPPTSAGGVPVLAESKGRPVF